MIPPRIDDQERENMVENTSRMNIQRLEEMLQAEREERRKLELQMERMEQEKELLEEQRERGRGEEYWQVGLL